MNMHQPGQLGTPQAEGVYRLKIVGATNNPKTDNNPIYFCLLFIDFIEGQSAAIPRVYWSQQYRIPLHYGVPHTQLKCSFGALSPYSHKLTG